MINHPGYSRLRKTLIILNKNLKLYGIASYVSGSNGFKVNFLFACDYPWSRMGSPVTLSSAIKT